MCAYQRKCDWLPCSGSLAVKTTEKSESEVFRWDIFGIRKHQFCSSACAKKWKGVHDAETARKKGNVERIDAFRRLLVPCAVVRESG
jgi:hypothetical protein